MAFKQIKIFNKAIKFVKAEVKDSISAKIALNKIKFAFERSKIGQIIAEYRGKSLPEMAEITSKNDKFNKEPLTELSKPEMSAKDFVKLRDSLKDTLLEKNIDETLLESIMSTTDKENITSKLNLYKKLQNKRSLNVNRAGSALVGKDVPDYRFAHKILYRKYLDNNGYVFFDKRKDVQELFRVLNNDNKEFINYCLSRKDADCYIDSGSAIANLVKTKNALNEEFINKALHRVGVEGFPVDSARDIQKVASFYQKSDMLEHCMNKKNYKGNYIYSAQEACEIANIYTNVHENKLLRNTVKYLIDRPEEFSSLEILDTMLSIKSEKDFSHLKTLLNSENLSSHQIVKALNHEDYSIIPEICFYKDYASEIKHKKEILSHCTKKKSSEYKKVVKSLYNLKDCSPDRFNKLYDSGLIDMIDSGKIPVLTLDGLSICENNFVSHSLLNDAKKVKLHEPLVKSFPGKIPVSTFMELVPNGEVGCFGETLYANDSGKPVKLNLTKEKFEELFPLVERFSMTQGSDLGDCWLISALDNLMDKPSTRIKLYKLFNQVGNDIIIKFPETKSELIFKNGNVINSGDRQVFASKGIKMLEQAFSVHRYNDYISSTSEISEYTDIKAQMKKLNSGNFINAVESLLGKKSVSSRFMFSENISEKALAKEEIIKNAKKPNVMIEFAFSNAIKNAEFDKAYNLSTRHAYFLNSYDPKDGLCYITNPHNGGIITEIPLYSLMRYIDQVEISKLK